MALNTQISQFRGLGRLPGGSKAPIPQLPPVKVQRTTAPGYFALAGAAEVISLRALADGFYFRLGLIALGNVPAASGDDQTIAVLAGESFDFMLPGDADAAQYQISIVALA